MTVVGMWLAIVGYGIAYAGAAKISGRKCGIVDAFSGRCGGISTASVTTSGQTVQTQLLAQQQQQAGMIGTQPIPQAA